MNEIAQWRRDSSNQKFVLQFEGGRKPVLIITPKGEIKVGEGCTNQEAAQALVDLANHMRQPVGQEPVELQFAYRHPDGRTHMVSVSADDVAREMPEFLSQALCAKLCQCQPVGETNVTDCCCDEDAEQFELIAAPPAQAVDLGQFRELAREMDLFRTKWKTVSLAEFNHYADRLLDLIDSQKDSK
jgi:hypothetical protein